MPSTTVDGRTYEAVVIKADPEVPLPVDIGDATINATIGDIQIANTNDDPVPVSDAGGSLTVDNAALTSIDGKLPALVDGKVPVLGSFTVVGGATESKQDSLLAAVDGVESLLIALDAAADSVDAKLPTLSGGAIPVTGALTDAQLRASAIAVAPNVQQGEGATSPTTTRVTIATDSPGVANLNLINSKLAAPRTPTTTSVASSATSVTILASNELRRGVSIANDSAETLRLSFSTPATAANAFIVLPPGSFLLMDQHLIVTNAIYGIWSAANGTAQVTEYI